MPVVELTPPLFLLKRKQEESIEVDSKMNTVTLKKPAIFFMLAFYNQTL